MQQTSRGKFDRLQRTTAGFTDTRLDGYGLCCSLPTRPRVQASYPILVHRHTPLLHASFRPRLATTPLRFANPSPPSGWIRDLHPQTVEHARHTMRKRHGLRHAFPFPIYLFSKLCGNSLQWIADHKWLRLSALHGSLCNWGLDKIFRSAAGAEAPPPPGGSSPG